MFNDVSSRMEYVQQVFLGVQDYMQHDPALEALSAFLEAEPPEYRSVAYESASMEVALRDLSRGAGLPEWEELYRRSSGAHSFHLEIGLGWAFAKTETAPDPYLGRLSVAPLRWMVFDGIGYYYGLFRGRRTVKGCEVPGYVQEPDLPGFDQGLGRRLWYISKGSPAEVARLIAPFPEARQAALWQGVGIACGYVGGCTEDRLHALATVCGGALPHLCRGIQLAAISRKASDTLHPGLDLASRVICKTPLSELNLTNPL